MVVARASEPFGPPDIAVYTPVAPGSGGFDAFTDADFEQAYAFIVKGFAHFARALVPHMKAQRWGRIVTIGSGAAKVPARQGHAGVRLHPRQHR